MEITNLLRIIRIDSEDTALFTNRVLFTRCTKIDEVVNELGIL